MKGVKILILVAVVAAVILSGYRLVVTTGGNGKTGDEMSKAALKAPESFYSSRLTDINGEIFDFEGLAGKKVILNFFATWCPPCKSEIPEFIAYRTRLRQEDNIVLISVDVNETPEDVKKFITDERYGINYPVLFDPSGALPDAYGVKAIPTTVFIDEKGEVVGKVTGAIPDLAAAAAGYFK